MSIGPQLPSHLRKLKDQAESEEDSDDEAVGPRLPDIPCRGPKPESYEEQEDEDVPLGPSLPPHLAKSKHEEDEDEEEDVPLGPALPPHLAKNRTQDQSEEGEEEDDEDIIGPMPPKPGQSGLTALSAAQDFEVRSQKMKDQLEGRNQPKEPKREKWMLELPPEKAKNFGLGPRTFSKSNKDPGKSSDRSVWTDTPEQKAKKLRGEVPEESDEASKDPYQDKDVLEYMASLHRDQEMEKVSAELREKRGTESLMDKHAKDLKRKKKDKEKANEPVERRPFDRDLDLQANRFDDAQKELMIKRARQLNDRFSKGAQKFL